MAAVYRFWGLRGVGISTWQLDVRTIITEGGLSAQHGHGGKASDSSLETDGVGFDLHYALSLSQAVCLATETC